MKDLSARWKVVLVLLALSMMLGFQTLHARVARLTAGQLTLNPSTISFGVVLIGSTHIQPGTLTNSGGSNLTISQFTVSGSEFQVSGLSLPLTLAPSQGTTFNVTFTPATSGNASATISVTATTSTSGYGNQKKNSSATNTSQTTTISVTGAGTDPGQLTATSTSIGFGSVQIGSSQTLSETLTNTGGSNVTISQATVTGTGFSISGLSLPFTLGVGQSKGFSITFAPQTAGSANGSVVIASDASNPTLSAALSGSGIMPGSLTSNHSTLSFGSVQTGSSQTLQETLTNSGGSNVSISKVTTIGSGFSVTGLNLPLTLVAGQSATLSVVFAPQAPSSADGSLSIASNASNSTIAVSLSGTGVTPGSLTASPSSLSFGSVQVGNSQPLQETVTNSGGSSVIITQAAVIGAGFSMSGMNVPVTLAPGQSATFNATFAPQSGGSASGNVSIASNASNATLTVPFSGTGVTPGSLTASPASLSFGSVQVGSSQPLQETVTNSGGSSVTITQAPVTGAGFSMSGMNLPVTLTPGQSATFNMTFAPQSGGGASGNVSIASNASNATLTVPFSGTGVTPGSLTASPASLSFGTLQVGNSATQTETLTNSGGSSVTISQANVTGSAFSITGLNLPLTLIAGQSFTFGIVLAPAAAGSASGSVSVVSNASNSTLTISLAGNVTAAGQLSVSPATLDFGSVIVGQTKSLSATLSATGSDVSVASATPSTSEFALSGISFPLSLAAGQSSLFTVTFRPQASGTATANASFASNASNSSLLESLTGSGTPPPLHSVDLSWGPSSSVVVGYNVFRGTKSGGPYTKITSVLDPGTAYTDSPVQAGQTYYYVTTDVDASGVESAYSNQVQAVIPSP